MRIAKKDFEFSKTCGVFRSFFKHSVLENGRGRHETGVCITVCNEYSKLENARASTSKIKHF